MVARVLAEREARQSQYEERKISVTVPKRILEEGFYTFQETLDTRLFGKRLAKKKYKLQKRFLPHAMLMWSFGWLLIVPALFLGLSKRKYLLPAGFFLQLPLVLFGWGSLNVKVLKILACNSLQWWAMCIVLVAMCASFQAMVEDISYLWLTLALFNSLFNAINIDCWAHTPSFRDIVARARRGSLGEENTTNFGVLARKARGMRKRSMFVLISATATVFLIQVLAFFNIICGINDKTIISLGLGDVSAASMFRNRGFELGFFLLKLMYNKFFHPNEMATLSFNAIAISEDCYPGKENIGVTPDERNRALLIFTGSNKREILFPAAINNVSEV